MFWCKMAQKSNKFHQIRIRSNRKSRDSENNLGNPGKSAEKRYGLNGLKIPRPSHPSGRYGIAKARNYKKQIYWTIGQFHYWTPQIIGPLDKFTIGQLTPTARENSKIVKS